MNSSRTGTFDNLVTLKNKLHKITNKGIPSLKQKLSVQKLVSLLIFKWPDWNSTCGRLFYYPTTPVDGEYGELIEGCNNFFIFTSRSSVYT